METSSIGSTAAGPDMTASEIAIRVAKLAQNVTKSQGEAAVSLLEAAVKFQAQERSYATGPGGNLDVVA